MRGACHTFDWVTIATVADTVIALELEDNPTNQLASQIRIAHQPGWKQTGLDSAFVRIVLNSACVNRTCHKGGARNTILADCSYLESIDGNSHGITCLDLCV